MENEQTEQTPELFINIKLQQNGPTYQTNMNDMMLPSLLRILANEIEKKIGAK